MNGDTMRKPRMPGVQELTEYRPVGVLECCCTIRTGRMCFAKTPMQTFLSAQGFSVLRYAMMSFRSSTSGTLITIFVP
jgi:hypothetical protein